MRKIRFIVSTKEISEIVWFDDSSNSVIIAFDNLTVTFTYQEFFHFLDSLKEAEQVLIGDSAIVKSSIKDDSGKSEEIYVVKSPDDDIEN